MPTPVNLHWQYYVNYFRPPNKAYIDWLDTNGQNKKDKPSPFLELKKRNDVLIDKTTGVKGIHYSNAYELLRVGDAQTFALTTTYPGLLVGSGYRHETGSTDELKLGFSFDFTTGLPILPGSSVKGLLRSAFPGDPNNSLYGRADGFIRYLLTSPAVNTGTDFDESFVRRLERELFEGQVPTAVDSAVYRDLPMSARDVFYDGLIGTDEANRVYGGALFGNDFITPHRNRKNPRMSPFTNPTPIQFLKVMPNVPVTFQFALPNRPGQLLTPDQRLKLYRAIIEELGVGAKTRVGYGQLQ